MEKVIIIKELIKGVVPEFDILEGDINLDRIIVEEIDRNKFSFRFVSYKNDHRLTSFFMEVISENNLTNKDVESIKYRQSKTLVGDALVDGDFISVNGKLIVKEEIDINKGAIVKDSGSETEKIDFLYAITKDNNNFIIERVDVNTEVNSLDCMKIKEKVGK